MHGRARTSLYTLAAIALAAPALAQGLDVPAKNLPVPQGDVSPQVQKLIAAPLRNGWNVLPKTGENGSRSQTPVPNPRSGTCPACSSA